MLEVQSPGFLSTVQDLGRAGLRHLGVAVGGAADRVALRTGNRLVGNADDAAGLEFTLTGACVRLTQARLVAITGAEMEASIEGQALPHWRPIACNAGTEIRFGRALRGARAYLAVGGGIEVPRMLGSRATDLGSGFGGWRGRALASGDRLALGRPRPEQGRALWRLHQRSGAAWRAAPWWVEPGDDLGGEMALLHLLPGADIGLLDPRVLRVLRDGVWTVGADSDRMGLRFNGPDLPRADGLERVSSAVVPGTIQLPPDGRPIVLGVDAQTVGGYPCVGHVIRTDLGRTMQLKPGERVRGVLVTPEAAQSIRRARARDHARMAMAIAARLAET
jgi:antagonist of KipI